MNSDNDIPTLMWDYSVCNRIEKNIIELHGTMASYLLSIKRLNSSYDQRTRGAHKTFILNMTSVNPPGLSPPVIISVSSGHLCRYQRFAHLSLSGYRSFCPTDTYTGSGEEQQIVLASFSLREHFECVSNIDDGKSS
ncbi:hypothetical protein JOB18_048881 [Solea senegalensis]|uniref:Uncharacterized protein n=1 Tax=Solea senegalensis TaxID=28829 RepID=A0AAV6SY83_SOLSE|nr:hypothetical protein JOB18_048881 [Solea senegalensis]